jgi:hypothetical protein
MSQLNRKHPGIFLLNVCLLLEINGVQTAVLFSKRWNRKPLTDKLFYELLENCTFFHSKGYEICLTGDFNGNVSTKQKTSGDFSSKCLFTS